MLIPSLFSITFLAIILTIKTDSVASSQCPVLFVDPRGAPFLSWLQLSPIIAAAANEKPKLCSSFSVFTPTKEQVCIVLDDSSRRKRWPPKERTINFHHNKPGQWRYPNAPNSPMLSLTSHNMENASQPWKRFENNIKKFRLYEPDDNALFELIENMQKLPIAAVKEVANLGTWFKLFLTLSDGTEVIFKPQNRDRKNARSDADVLHFSDFERHNAEIAAYHLDQVLGFYRVPPTVGRLLNITQDIEPFASKNLSETIYISPIGNKCIHGNCAECKMYNAVCGKPDLIEGSVQYMLPFTDDIVEIEAPYARSYWKFRKPVWLNDLEYCHQVEVNYYESRMLLDIMDVAIFDFLIGNQDRHDLYFFPQFVNESSPLMFDNGRSLGNPDFDDELILSPIVHCCLVRYSTLKRLVKFQRGATKLSQAFDQSSRRDLVYPLLTDDFLPALDRRLEIIVNKIDHCVRANKFHNVVIDDGF